MPSYYRNMFGSTVTVPDQVNYKQPARKIGKRRYRRRYGNSAKSIAYKALRTARYANKQASGERHFIDYGTVGTAVNVDYNGTSTVLNDPAQGTTDTTRVGDNIIMKKAIVNGKVLANTSSADVRILIVYDKNDTYSTVSSVLSSVGNSDACLSQRSWDARFGFNVLYDNIFDCVVGADSEKQNFQIKLNLKNLRTQFDAGTQNFQAGALRMIMISNRVTTNLPTVSYNTRVEYVDN